MIHLHEIFPSFFWKTIPEANFTKPFIVDTRSHQHHHITFFPVLPFKTVVFYRTLGRGQVIFKIWSKLGLYPWEKMHMHSEYCISLGGFMMPCSRTAAVWKWSKDVVTSINCGYNLIYFKWNNTWLFELVFCEWEVKTIIYKMLKTN